MIINHPKTTRVKDSFCSEVKIRVSLGVFVFPVRSVKEGDFPLNPFPYV